MAISDRKVLYGINNEILTEELFSAETILANANTSSSAIGLNLSGGQFSLQIEVTGDGTAKIEWLGSNNGTDYIKPNNASDIITAFTKTDGPGGDGKGIYSFNVSLVKFLKIKISETVGANSITVTATLAIQ